MRADGQRIVSRAFETPEGAERILDATVAEVAEQISEPVGARTLLTEGPKWLDARELAGGRASYTERSVWKNHIGSAAFANWPLRNIEREHVSEWLADLRKKRALASPAWQKGKRAHRPTSRTLSCQTRRHCRNLLSKFFDDMIDKGLVSANPAKGLRVANDQPTEEAWTFLTMLEINQLAACEKIPADLRDLGETQIYTGMRRGEAWALKWRNVILDDPNPRIEIRRSHRGTTKNGKVRHAPLFARAVDALKRQRERVPHEPNDLVWPAPGGGQRPRNDDAGWADRRKGSVVVNGVKTPVIVPGWKTRAGITRRVRFHDLRHTCASHLVMGTWGEQWSLEETCEFMGHSSIDVTQRYAHLSPDHMHRKAALTAVTKAIATSNAPAHCLPANEISTPPVASPSAPARVITVPASRGPENDFPVGHDPQKPSLTMTESHAISRGAGDRDRTGDVQLGKLTFYR